MKIKTKALAAAALIFTFCFTTFGVSAFAAVVPNNQNATDTGLGASSVYQVGYMDAQSGTLSNPNMQNAFTNAFGLFEPGYQPTSHVQLKDGYYSQTFANNEGRNASVFVGEDNKAYTVGYPIYDSWEKVGGVTKTGYPTDDVYNINDEYYQNFSKGYIRYRGTDDVIFTESKTVDRHGFESDITIERTDNQNNVNNFSITENETTRNETLRNETTDQNNQNGVVRPLLGTGADGSGVAGSLTTTQSVNPVMVVTGVIILAAIIILFVALSYAFSKKTD